MKSALIVLIGSIGFIGLQSAAQGLPTGKRQHNPVVTKSMDTTKPKATANSINSPRDLSSGQATGKRQHLPVNSAANTNRSNVTKQTGQVNKTKLDDLKNPFDTTKKIKPVQQQPAGQNNYNSRRKS
jgi:hypothetical protein